MLIDDGKKIFKKWNRDQMSEKYANKLEVKEVWKQIKDGAQPFLMNKFYGICYHILTAT